MKKIAKKTTVEAVEVKVDISTPEARKAAAKKTAEMLAAKKAEANAQLANAAAGNLEQPKAKITRSKAAKTAEVKKEEETPAAKVEVKKGPTQAEIAAQKQAAKQAKRTEYVKQAAILVIKAGLLKKDDIEYRAAREEVKAGDIVVYHNTQGFHQILQVEHISAKGTLSLELVNDDAKNQKAGSAGSWTAESWDYNYLLNVFASKAESRDKKLEYCFLGKK